MKMYYNKYLRGGKLLWIGNTYIMLCVCGYRTLVRRFDYATILYNLNIISKEDGSFNKEVWGWYMDLYEL